MVGMCTFQLRTLAQYGWMSACKQTAMEGLDAKRGRSIPGRSLYKAIMVSTLLVDVAQLQVFLHAYTLSRTTLSHDAFVEGPCSRAAH